MTDTETSVLLAPGLARVDNLLALHLAEAVQRFGAGALAVVDLPPLRDGEIQPAQIRAAATLYWLMELEEAGLPTFVERLAEGMHTGRAGLLVGREGGDALGRFWRGRQQRFTPVERAALYRRVFHGPDGAAALLEALVDDLEALGRAPLQESLVGHEARINAAAGRVAQALSAQGAGITAFAAREMVATVRQCLALLQHPALRSALGPGDVWSAIRRHGPQLLGRPVEPDVHVRRAESGVRVLEWVAEESTRLVSGRARIGRGHPVVRAAATWRATRAAPAGSELTRGLA